MMTAPSRRYGWFALRTGAAIPLLVMLAPTLVVVLAGLNSGEYLRFPPEGLSIRWLVEFVASEQFRNAFLFSLGVALSTMLICTVVGTLAAVALVRGRFPGRLLLRALLLAPLILPSIVIGLSLYSFYLVVGLGLSRSVPGLVIGHTLESLPWVVALVSTALVSVDRSTEEAARSLGAGPVTAFFKVTLPQIAPGVISGAIFALIVSFTQFETSLFLSTPNNTPLPIEIYHSLRYSFDPTAAAAGVFSILLIVTAVLAAGSLFSLRQVGASSTAPTGSEK